MTNLEKFRSVDLEPISYEQSHTCWACHDTGFVIQSWRLRDESSFPFPSTLPPIACRANPPTAWNFCKALYSAHRSWRVVDDDGVKREETTNNFSQIELEVRKRGYDTRATQQQCLELHREGKQDACSRSTDPSKPKELQRAIRANQGRIGRSMPPAEREPSEYSEQEVDRTLRRKLTIFDSQISEDWEDF